jgi:hypothetical protein
MEKPVYYEPVKRSFAILYPKNEKTNWLLYVNMAAGSAGAARATSFMNLYSDEALSLAILIVRLRREISRKVCEWKAHSFPGLEIEP